MQVRCALTTRVCKSWQTSLPECDVCDASRSQTRTRCQEFCTSVLFIMTNAVCACIHKEMLVPGCMHQRWQTICAKGIFFSPLAPILNGYHNYDNRYKRHDDMYWALNVLQVQPPCWEIHRSREIGTLLIQHWAWWFGVLLLLGIYEANAQASSGRSVSIVLLLLNPTELVFFIWYVWRTTFDWRPGR
jgi:hypothetical protein